MILGIRTDKPEAELYLHDGKLKPRSYTWTAHRELSNTLLSSIETFLAEQGITLQNITGIAFFRGPGSFTGLRIGATTANALAYALGIPLSLGSGDAWLEEAIQAMPDSYQSSKPLDLNYGADPRITQPRK